MARSGSKGGGGPEAPHQLQQGQKGSIFDRRRGKNLLQPETQKKGTQRLHDVLGAFSYGRPLVAGFLVKDCPRIGQSLGKVWTGFGYRLGKNGVILTRVY